MSKTTLGSFEVVSIDGLGLTDIIAKVDTGAYSGAVHCTNIKVVRKGVLRKPYLQFTPAGNPEHSTETDDFKKRFVRSASGHRLKRYIIKTTITVQGIQYPIEIGLSDRSDMKRQILIGRKFIRENSMLVDVNRNAEFDDEKEVKL